MPSYVVRKIAATPDGSQVGSGQVMVTAPDIKSAKESGASMLGCSPTHVTAEPYANPHWNDLRNS